MKQNVNYNYWVESVSKMDENKLLNIIQNSGGYNIEFIQIVKDRLTKEFHHSEDELADYIANAEVKYNNQKIAQETDRQISLFGRAIAIISLLVLNVFGIIGVLLIRSRKVKNSLGERRYLYNENSRDWLLYCIIAYFGLALVCGIINVLLSYL